MKYSIKQISVILSIILICFSCSKDDKLDEWIEIMKKQKTKTKYY